jgi:hypothetical protein
VSRFLFVCGCARSGTSALVKLFNAHSQISIGMERYISRFLSGKGLSPELFEEKRFFSVEKGDTFYQDLEYFKPLYESLQKKWRHSLVIGDKIPKLYTKYGQVFERFPEARIVFVARNLIDVASSYKRRAEDETDQEWSHRRDATKAIDDWNSANLLTLSAKEQYPNQVYVLSYESLFIHNRGIEELFKFIDLEPTDAVLKHFQIEMQKSSAVRAQRIEILSGDEKLAICLRADSRSFRQLLETIPVAASAAQPAPAQLRASPPKALGKPPPAREQPSAKLQPAPQKGGNGDARSGKYQDSDRAIVDYEYALLPGTSTLVRGPIPKDLSAGFIACLGGAHTLGRFVELPYPAILQTQLNTPVLNLGHGGGKPEFYLQSPGIVEVLNKARCVVVQVMSARGSPNRFLKPTSISHNIMSIAKGISAVKNPAFVDAAYRTLLKQLDTGKLKEAVAETRSNWLLDMGGLLDRITVPKLLFWFSVRTPAYVTMFDTLDALLCEYPQLVTDEMIAVLKPKANDYVQCISTLGMPYALRDAKSHEPVDVFPWQPEPAMNNYYPSAEMHSMAADSLAPAIRRLIQ